MANRPTSKTESKALLNAEQQVKEAQAVILALKQRLAIAVSALGLISAPMRSDGTYNRCREACEQLARDTLAKLEKT